MSCMERERERQIKHSLDTTVYQTGLSGSNRKLDGTMTWVTRQGAIQPVSERSYENIYVFFF